MEYQISRPETIDDDAREEIRRSLVEKVERAVRARQSQVDNDYKRWDKLYRGEPNETIRTVPWYGASNIVVKLIRIFLDTQVARTQNLMFATKPLYVIDGLMREVREAYQLYLNLKATHVWDHYALAGELLSKGGKFGTAISKTAWVDTAVQYVDAKGEDVEVKEYEGPRTRVIPFQDFAVLPIDAERDEDVELICHRIRKTKEEALRLVAMGKWILPKGTSIETLLTGQKDSKRLQDQTASKVTDSDAQEVHLWEAHFKYLNNGKDYQLVGIIHLESETLVDLQYRDRPPYSKVFSRYCPYARDDFYFGESLCQILDQTQEEATAIHNDRRNASFLSNSPMFKRKSGSLIPDPSTNWYPGKVWDLEDINDFEVILLQANYNSMIEEEGFTIQLAERLSGIGAPLQAFSAGQTNQRGVYNAMGTVALLQEGNQRQHTHIRDARTVMSGIAHSEAILDAIYGDPANDAILDLLPEEKRRKVKKLLGEVDEALLRQVRFELKSSNAGANTELNKASLMQMAGVLAQYGQTVNVMAQQLADPKLNQSVRIVLNDTVKMHKWMAERLLYAFEEYDAEGILPDVATAIDATIPGGGAGSEEILSGAGQKDMDSSGPPEAQAALSRRGLQDTASMVELPGNGDSLPSM